MQMQVDVRHECMNGDSNQQRHCHDSSRTKSKFPSMIHSDPRRLFDAEAVYNIERHNNARSLEKKQGREKRSKLYKIKGEKNRRAEGRKEERRLSTCRMEVIIQS